MTSCVTTSLSPFLFPFFFFFFFFCGSGGGGEGGKCSHLETQQSSPIKANLFRSRYMCQFEKVTPGLFPNAERRMLCLGYLSNLTPGKGSPFGKIFTWPKLAHVLSTEQAGPNRDAQLCCGKVNRLKISIATTLRVDICNAQSVQSATMIIDWIRLHMHARKLPCFANISEKHVES